MAQKYRAKTNSVQHLKEQNRIANKLRISPSLACVQPPLPSPTGRNVGGGGGVGRLYTSYPPSQIWAPVFSYHQYRLKSRKGIV